MYKHTVYKFVYIYIYGCVNVSCGLITVGRVEFPGEIFVKRSSARGYSGVQRGSRVILYCTTWSPGASTSGLKPTKTVLKGQC